MLTTPLTHATELKRLMGRVRLLDARIGRAGDETYEAAHLSGALEVSLDRDLSGDLSRPERGGRHPLPTLGAFARTLGGWGIDPQTPVVIYDAGSGARAAARAWWMLRAVGHASVAVLDGGLAAARRAGLPIDDAVPPRVTCGPYPVPARWGAPIVTAEEVEARRGDPAWRLIDVRTNDRYRGESDPYDPRPGHIPGALGLPLAESLDADGCFLVPSELRAHFSRHLGAEVDPARVVVSCGSGVTACHTLLALELAGLGGGALYVGSFSEWSRQGRPVVRGDGAGA